MSKIDAWKAVREETLQNLDIRSKFEEFGVKFTGKVSSTNWAECYAFGRSDKNPSAAVNLTTGVYKDFAGDRLSIFDFMVQHNLAPDWQEAQVVLAKSVGLAKKIPKKAKAKRTADLLGFTQKFSLVAVVPLARSYDINPRVIEMTGARIARYPESSNEPQMVCAFPIFDPVSMLETPPESYILQSGSGQPIMVYQGPDVPARPEKRIVIGHTGILNKHALEKWEQAERIYKVEGLSDMLVLQNFIPEELRDRHLVITNACGCDDAAPAWGLANHCTGKDVVIIHDADVPGQYGTGKDQAGGAQRWVKALKNSAKSLRNLQLPYEVEEKHGKDLRNWIQEPGRKYSDLLELVAATKDEIAGKIVDGTGSVVERTPSQKILDRLNLVVLGHTMDRSNTVLVFHMRLRRRFAIPDIDKFTYNRMLLTIGEEARTEIDPSPEPTPVKISIKQLREAIAMEACGRRISRESAIGIGIWEINGKLVFVGSGEWMAMNGDLRSYQTPEIDEKLVDFGEGAESWYDEEEIRHYLSMAVDPAWRIEFLKEFAGIFEMWDNWSRDKDDNKLRSYLVSNLLLCSWLQDIWTWRPWVSVTGETNSGKTAFFGFITKYFGPQMALSMGSSSEAGLRQSIGTSSKIMLLDEFEASKERTKTLDWLKNAGAGNASVRGTPGQYAVKGKVKVMPWFGSIEACTTNESERNRYIMFPMASRIGKPRFTLPTDEDIKILRSKSLAILMRVWVRAKELHEHLQHKCEIKGVYSRYTESHSLPIAMWAAIAGMTNTEAESLFYESIGTMMANIQFNSESEHGTLINEILFSKVDCGRGERRMVSELLTGLSQSIPHSDDTPDLLLARNGLRKMYGKDFKDSPFQPEERVLFIACTVVRPMLLRNTVFGDKGIDQILERVPRSFRAQKRLGGSKARGIVVPMEAVIPSESASERAVNEGRDDFVPPEHRANGGRSISEDVFNEKGAGE